MQKITTIKSTIALSPETACTAVEHKLCHTWSYLSHFPSIEKVFHDKQIQFLFSVVLRILVSNSIHPKDFGQCCGLLIKERLWVRSLHAGKQSDLRSTTVPLQLRIFCEIPMFHLEHVLNTTHIPQQILFLLKRKWLMGTSTGP